MKQLSFLLLFQLTIYTGWCQTEADLGVAAIGLVVSDIQASERFYKEVLGMSEVGSFSLDQQWSQEAGAAHGQPFSVKMFKMKNQPTATVLKLAYFENTAKQPTRAGIDEQSGVNYISLYYDSKGFEEVSVRIKEAGFQPLGLVKRASYQLFFVKDPDGLFVEIVGLSDE